MRTPLTREGPTRLIWTAGVLGLTFQVATRLLALLLMSAASLAFAEPEFQSIQIPRVSEPPKLEEFLGMEVPPHWQGKMAKVDRFTQRVPSDGAPVSQRTEA